MADYAIVVSFLYRLLLNWVLKGDDEDSVLLKTLLWARMLRETNEVLNGEAIARITRPFPDVIIRVQKNGDEKISIEFAIADPNIRRSFLGELQQIQEGDPYELFTESPDNVNGEDYLFWRLVKMGEKVTVTNVTLHLIIPAKEEFFERAIVPTRTTSQLEN